MKDAARLGALSLVILAGLLGIVDHPQQLPPNSSTPPVALTPMPVLPAQVYNVGSVTRSFVTSTGAVGFQPSATKSAFVSYNVESSIATSIGGPTDAVVVLEMAATNSATPSDWIEVARHRNSQTATLAIALNLVQVIAAQLNGYVRPAWYLKLRTVTGAGSPSYTYKSGWEAFF